MTNTDFNKAVEEQIEYCKKLLVSKGNEYSEGKAIKEPDRFHAFRVAAELQGCSEKQALAGMMAKHTVSVYDMCQGEDYPIEKWEEKITDSINYLLLLKAMIVEEKEQQSKVGVSA